MRHYEYDPTDARFVLVDGKRREIGQDGLHYKPMNEHGYVLADFENSSHAVHADGRSASRIDPVEVAGRQVEWVVSDPKKDHTILASTFDLYRTGWEA